MSTEQQPILEVLDHPAFDKLASAIRMSTVKPHINRERKKRGEPVKPYPFDPNYDLTSSLLSAAERGPEDFLREFYSFASRYNDETARPGKEGKRALLRDGDLAQLTVWMHNRRLRSLVPYALLAFGTSLRKKTGDAAGDIDTAQQDLANGNGGEADNEDE